MSTSTQERELLTRAEIPEFLAQHVSPSAEVLSTSCRCRAVASTAGRSRSALGETATCTGRSRS